MPHVTPVILAQALDVVSASQLHNLGMRVSIERNTSEGAAMYVQALSILSQYNWVAIDEAGKASNLSIANMTDASGIGKKVGVVEVSVPASSFAWAHISGKVTAKVAQACADRVPLFPTSTVGVVDDATSSAGGLLLGCYTVTSTSTASAITVIMATTGVTFNWSNPA